MHFQSIILQFCQWSGSVDLQVKVMARGGMVCVSKMVPHVYLDVTVHFYCGRVCMALISDKRREVILKSLTAVKSGYGTNKNVVNRKVLMHLSSVKHRFCALCSSGGRPSKGWCHSVAASCHRHYFGKAPSPQGHWPCHWCRLVGTDLGSLLDGTVLYVCISLLKGKGEK